MRAAAFVPKDWFHIPAHDVQTIQTTTPQVETLQVLRRSRQTWLTACLAFLMRSRITGVRSVMTRLSQEVQIQRTDHMFHSSCQHHRRGETAALPAWEGDPSARSITSHARRTDSWDLPLMRHEYSDWTDRSPHGIREEIRARPDGKPVHQTLNLHYLFLWAAGANS